jgi:5-methylcytosine-specific restriction endonuclease McrA
MAKEWIAYDEQLKDPRWQYVRARVLERDKWKCCGCRTMKDLQVHHKSYEKGKMAWDYPDSNLITLCEKCHKQAHSTGDVPLSELQQKLNAFVVVCTPWVHSVKSKNKFNG